MLILSCGSCTIGISFYYGFFRIEDLKLCLKMIIFKDLEANREEGTQLLISNRSITRQAIF